MRAASAAHLFDRKLLVAPTRGAARELLRAFAREQGGWSGWEPATPSGLALDLAADELAAAGLRTLDDFEREALVDAALDLTLESADDPWFEPLREGVGFREAVAGAISALRLAGVSAARLRESALRPPAKRALLGDVLAGYEESLETQGVTDTAGVLQRATTALRRGGALPRDTRVYLLPGLGATGLPGEFLAALRQRGAELLAAERVDAPVPRGILWNQTDEPPRSARAERLELFSAAGPAAELREVCRRVLAAGLRWDEVEIVATDATLYGSALHALGERLEIPVSFAVGLPVERTRPGRATAAYFRWMSEGFPADALRVLLEAGDLAPPTPHRVSGPALARRLRKLRIGWGRDRYLPAVRAGLEAAAGEPFPRRGESVESAARRAARERRELEALRVLLTPILSRTPAIPADLSDPRGAVAPADLATGLQAFLRRVPAGTSADATARERLLEVLERVRATRKRPTAFDAALATLRRHLQIRVPAPRAEGSAPWGSSGGYLYLSDLEHGGFSGRSATFVVGLDAGRFPGAGLQDPLLLDADRRTLGADGLPTSADRLAERRFRFAALLARLRGEVTLSYSAWDAAEARELAPSAVLLQAYRAQADDPTATYEALHRHLGRPASAVPAGDFRLDAVDVWLAALEKGGRLLRGVSAVRRLHPALDRGLAAREALVGPVATPHHGLVGPRPELLDPRRNREVVLSASRLEALGSCPFRYFQRNVLRLRPLDDPEYDPQRWLDALNRGSLLHSFYERSLREARERGIALETPAFEAHAIAVLELLAARMRDEVPPPSEAIYLRELEMLRRDARSFAAAVVERGAPWLELEFGFGMGDDRPFELPLPGGGSVALAGRIDRIDERPEGLVVIDYKSGSSFGHGPQERVYRGGRRLQHAVYAQAVEQRFGRAVIAAEYHFPTPKCSNDVRSYSATDLRDGTRLIERLLDGVAAGTFVPTDHPGDCKFCDFAAICRVRIERHETVSPRAQWGREHIAELPAYGPLRDARGWEAG
ncbi:PD-(D/E)XK nuclease family protein [soil metagenome]